MADRADMLAEAYQRGILPPDMRAMYEEAQKRGLLSKPGYVDAAVRTIDDVVRSIARGATFGYADEIAAKMEELTGRGGSYEQNLAKEQAQTADVSGLIRIPGEIGGAVAATVAAAPVRGVAGAVTGLSKLPGLARTVLGGAAGGALYGSEEAGPGNRLSLPTVEGAAIGAVGGPIAAGIARGVKAVVSPVKAALFDIERALQRDEITAEHAGKLIGALGAEGRAGTLADVGGENVRGLMERVSQTPGAGRTVATPFLETRQVQQASRIADDLSELAGTKKSAFEAVTQTMAQRASEGKPLYQKAMDYNARADADIVAAWEEATSTG
jgi:hypothetical protein